MTFAVGVMLSASVSLITPFEPSCILVYGPGKYKFGDFVKIGGIITILLMIVIYLECLCCGRCNDKLLLNIQPIFSTTMHLFFLFSVLITLAALISYLNVRLFKISPGIILMLMGTLIAVVLIIAGNLSPKFTETIEQTLAMLDFSEFVIGMLLSLLLSAYILLLK